jgi:hypothetical protein
LARERPAAADLSPASIKLSSSAKAEDLRTVERTADIVLPELIWLLRPEAELAGARQVATG